MPCMFPALKASLMHLQAVCCLMAKGCEVGNRRIFMMLSLAHTKPRHTIVPEVLRAIPAEELFRPFTSPFTSSVKWEGSQP